MGFLKRFFEIFIGSTSDLSGHKYVVLDIYHGWGSSIAGQLMFYDTSRS
jgi:hypothetical protein